MVKQFALKILFLLFLTSLMSRPSQGQDVPYLFVNSKLGAEILTHLSSAEIYESLDNGSVSVIKINPLDLSKAQQIIEDTPGLGCGRHKISYGVASAEKRIQSISAMQNWQESKMSFTMLNNTIDQQSLVNPMLNDISSSHLLNLNLGLSAFRSRYFQTNSGVSGMKWIYYHWRSMTIHRNDVQVQLFEHSWPQPSVLLKLEGSDPNLPGIVLGAHGDSTNEDKLDFAPGADDDGSGVASHTEVLRLMMENNFKPKRSIYFFAYSAEEAGLLGSDEIAMRFKGLNIPLKGVLQSDMIIYKNPNTPKIIYLISDFTDVAQNSFMVDLINTYVGVSWAYMKCTYACSDHASWNDLGYPSSFPFESGPNLNDSNPNIHTINDTMSFLNNSYDHGIHFVKLALAYAVEMSNK
ncbi:MAG: M20/M25/M40 family metallo-hydrolase [Bacteriovoracaceae bacterium]|nr:M20/M25/M40 family metallo-hydrolase [Bacteriovoracaceae bacterium]